MSKGFIESVHVSVPKEASSLARCNGKFRGEGEGTQNAGGIVTGEVSHSRY